MWIMSRKISINRMNKSMLSGSEYMCFPPSFLWSELWWDWTSSIRYHFRNFDVSPMLQAPFIVSIVFTSLQWIDFAAKLTRNLPHERYENGIFSQYTNKYWIRDHCVSAICIQHRKEIIWMSVCCWKVRCCVVRVFNLQLDGNNLYYEIHIQ